ncbi:hypothetical protein [Companilactobacillus metriopterae]|uniref:hypothetical protein n=1 Tax=Companilactobacillus metriopterae TaxID=1909267 RepID=UPI00100C0D0D|nr:hypothetical protein [Companilactobacillus metriopterae]
MLKTNKNIYLSGTSSDGDILLSNFNANFDDTGRLTITENPVAEDKTGIAEKDFEEFRKLARKQSSEILGGEVKNG